MKIGTMELLVILLVAFLVLGPDKTAMYTKKLGKGLRTLRIYMNSFTEDITETVTEPLQELQKPLEELKKPLEDLQKPLEESIDTVRAPIDELRSDIRMNDAKLRKPIDLKSKPKAEKKASEPAAEVEEAIPVAEPEEAIPVAEIEEAIPVEPTEKV